MSDNLPAWAMEQARGIVAKRCPTTSLSDLVIKGAIDNAEPDIRDIARALCAADKAATERAARIAETHDGIASLNAEIAAAIRNQEGKP